MLSITHGVVGAFVATKIQQPAAAVPIILGLHYLGDWVPHWDIGTGLTNGKRRRLHAFVFEIGDLVIMFTLLALFWQWGQDKIMWPVYWGAIVGIFPDLMLAPRTFLKWEPKWMKPLSEFHKAIHHSTPQIIFGILPQVLLILLVYLLK